MADLRNPELPGMASSATRSVSDYVNQWFLEMLITTSYLVKVEFSVKRLTSARLLDKMKDTFL
jgi:hypothetical protein